MINNICENIKTTIPTTAFKAALVDNSKHNGKAKVNDAVMASKNSDNNICRGTTIQTTYGHGIWYSEIIDGASNAKINAIVHKQQYSNNGSNSQENAVNKNIWMPTGGGNVQIASEQRQQQRQQQEHKSHSAHTNNECDIIIVDIENENDDNDDDDYDDNDENEDDDVVRQRHHQQQHTYNVPPKFFMNLKFSQKHPTICDSERGATQNNITCSANNNDGHFNTFDIVAVNQANYVKEEDEDDSLDSMETVSDNVSIWIEGEKHWVAGVDANTTCSDLIGALLNYQNEQQLSERQPLQQHPSAFTVAITIPATTNENIAATVINKTKCIQYEKHELLKQQQQQQKQQLPKLYEHEGSYSMCTDNKPNNQNTANTNNIPNDGVIISNTSTSTSTSISSTISTNCCSSTNTSFINQSMPINTKENYKIFQNAILVAATKTTPIPSSSPTATPIISSSLASVSETTPPPPPLTLLPLTLPPGIGSVSQLATEYVIVRQYHHCEEYLDGSAKVFDVLPPRNGSNKKQCELLLRHLGPAPAVYVNNTTPQLSSLISTDKDSGMGSPVGSARSAKFRRRKHKSSQWLAQANTLHPKLSRCTSNERLMKIILSQDETIQRQLSLLREKERQITKIEEEKHRKRERELGKNYLLETYLNGLDEADCEPEIQDSEEIFIDEPYQREVSATTNTATFARMAIKPSAVTLAAGAVTDKIPSAIEALNAMARHKLKEREAKKEKKKKRHKEKQTMDEEIQAKDFNLKINKDKEKVDQQQQQQPQQQELHELKGTVGNNNQKNGNEQEIEMQILWLEKIYTLNKQLQREEELAAKLHAKVRKHQLRKAQQTHREAQMEIDKLDNNLALQCGDIRKVEANLMQTNEQLQKKLIILERLSIEYLREEEQQQQQQENDKHNTQEDIKNHTVKAHTTKSHNENPLKNETNMLLTNLEKTLDIQKLSLNNIKSKEEVIKLEKIIAKPSKDLRSQNAELKETKQNFDIVAQNVANNLDAANNAPVQTNQRFSNVTSISTNRCEMFALTDNQQQHHHHHHHHQQPYQQQHELTITAAATTVPVAGQTAHCNEGRSNDTTSTSCMFIDKNMLSSLHVQNAKTIKKQMFHTQTTSAASATTQLLPPPTASAFPKRQFQQTIQQYMPEASTFLNSRPPNSHQIQETNILKVQQTSTAANSCPTHSASSTLSATTAPAASVLIVQHPPTSISPSPSIMAMNTVDISQLGTLV